MRRGCSGAGRAPRAGSATAPASGHRSAAHSMPDRPQDYAPRATTATAPASGHRSAAHSMPDRPQDYAPRATTATAPASGQLGRPQRAGPNRPTVIGRPLGARSRGGAFRSGRDAPPRAWLELRRRGSSRQLPGAATTPPGRPAGDELQVPAHASIRKVRREPPQKPETLGGAGAFRKEPLWIYPL
jgi:hypothetical protein